MRSKAQKLAFMTQKTGLKEEFAHEIPPFEI
jgi:hypothetical protein